MTLGLRIFSIIAVLSMAGAGQDGQWPQLRPVFVAGGFDLPVDIQAPRDGTWRLFIVEQAGKIKVMENLEVLESPFLDLSAKVRSGGERGLLGLAFPPDFAEKRHFYVNYTEGQGAPDLRTVVARYKVSEGDPNRADPDSEERILVVDQPFDNHNAGQLVFGPDGYLYIGMGDGGSGNDPLGHAQDLQSLLGKMLRIDVEADIQPYSVPPGNPFAGSPGARDEIWSLGLRNPWRYSFDRATADLYIADVGQNRREEVNFEAAGSPGGVNYGWPEVEGALCNVPGCDLGKYTAPVFDYTQVGSQSVTGGFVYRGGAHTGWLGTYLFGDYVSGSFKGLRRRNGVDWEAIELLRLPGWNLSTFGEDEGGEILVARHLPDGRGEIWKLADERPVTKPWLVVNSASGEAGAAPGSRLNIYGWSVSTEPGVRNAEGRTDPELSDVRVWFDEIPAGIISVLNLGGSEGVVVEAPMALAGRDVTQVVVEREGLRSEAVEVEVSQAHPGLFELLAPAHLDGGGAVLFGTGFGEVDSEGNCALAVRADMAGQVPETLFCRSSQSLAGVYELGIRVPEGLAGEVAVTVTAGGVASPQIIVTLP